MPVCVHVNHAANSCSLVLAVLEPPLHLPLPVYLPTCLPACLPAYLPACLPFCLPTCLPSQVILDAETFRGVHARLNELGGAVLEATQGLLGGRLTRTVMAAATAGMLKQAADKQAADIEQQQQQQGALRCIA